MESILRTKSTVTQPNNSPFRDRNRSFLELSRLGYAPVLLDSNGKPSKILGTTLAISHGGLTLVTCSDGVTVEAIENPEWSPASCFVDASGSVGWLFAGIGDYSLDDVLGYGVESRLAAPGGVQTMESFLTVPPAGLMTWIREPNVFKHRLPALPTALRNEIVFQVEHVRDGK